MAIRLAVDVDEIGEAVVRWPSPLKRRVPIVLELNEPLIDRRELPGIPRMSTTQLKQHVALHQDRYFPRRNGNRVSDAKWIRARSKPDVAVAVSASATLIAQLLAEGRARGVEVIDVAPTGRRWSALSLLPPETLRVRRLREWKRASMVLTASLCVVCVAFGVAYNAKLYHIRTLESAGTISKGAVAKAQAAARLRADSAVMWDAVQHTAHENLFLAQFIERVVSLGERDSAFITGFSMRATGEERIDLVTQTPSTALMALRARGDTLKWKIVEGPTFVEQEGERWTRLSVGRTRVRE